jgi:hypothetical protein
MHESAHFSMAACALSLDLLLLPPEYSLRDLRVSIMPNPHAADEIVSVYPPVLGVALQASVEGLLGLEFKSLSFVSVDVFR